MRPGPLSELIHTTQNKRSTLLFEGNVRIRLSVSLSRPHRGGYGIKEKGRVLEEVWVLNGLLLVGKVLVTEGRVIGD